LRPTSSTRTDLEEVGPADWDDVLRRAGVTDVYAGRGFVRASAELVGAEPVLLDGGDFVFPVLVRDDPCDVVSPYGYGGPIGDLAGFRPAYAAWCAARGVISSFVVFHPLFGNDREELGFHRVPLGGTVGWRLDAPDLRARMHPHHRRLVRRAERDGLTATAHPAPSDLDEFVDLYLAAMRRLEASPFYIFPDSYWAALVRDVPLVRVDVRDGTGALVAGVLGMGRPPWLHYHLGGSTEAGRGTGASHLALVSLAEWGQANGYELLHLGGGVGGRADSLLEYKRRRRAARLRHRPRRARRGRLRPPHRERPHRLGRLLPRLPRGLLTHGVLEPAPEREAQLAAALLEDPQADEVDVAHELVVPPVELGPAR
jgi:serine/alanine adding enzyme